MNNNEQQKINIYERPWRLLEDLRYINTSCRCESKISQFCPDFEMNDDNRSVSAQLYVCSALRMNEWSTPCTQVKHSKMEKVAKEEEEELDENEQQIEEVSDFKMGIPLYPRAKGKIKLKPAGWPNDQEAKANLW